MYLTKYVKKAIAILAITCIVFNVQAQSAVQSIAPLKLSLAKAVDLALLNNLNVKSYQVNLRNAELQYQQSKYNQLPSLNGNINQAASFGRSINPYTNSYDSRNINYNNVGINANVTIFNGGQLKNSILQSDYNLKATQEDLQAMRENTSLQVVLSYLTILNAEDQLAIAQTQTGITQLQIQRAQKLVAAGSLPQSNVLDLKAQLASEESNVVSFQSNLDINKLTLVQLLNDTSITDFQLERISVPVPSTSLYELGISDIYFKALDTQPLIKAADFRVKGADKNIDIAKAFRLPTLSLSGSWSANQSNSLKSVQLLGTQDVTLGNVQVAGINYPIVSQQPRYGEGQTVDYFDQLNNTQNKVVSLNLNIPIFSKYQNKTRISQASLQRESAELEASKARLTLRQNIEQAYVNMSNAAKKYDASVQQVAALEESFRSAESKFSAGTIDFVSYNLQKTNLDKAKLSLVQARYDYVFRTKVLDYYQGKNLTF